MLGLLFLLCTGIFLLNRDAPSDTKEERQVTPTVRQKLAAILKKKQYSKQELHKLKAEISTSPEYNLELAECLAKLIDGPDKSSGHPENTRYLLLHASAQQLPAHELATYYLRAVISTYNTEDWIQQNLQTDVLRHWKTLFRDHPDIKQHLLKHTELRPYMQPLINAAESL